MDGSFLQVGRAQGPIVEADGALGRQIVRKPGNQRCEITEIVAARVPEDRHGCDLAVDEFAEHRIELGRRVDEHRSVQVERIARHRQDGTPLGSGDHLGRARQGVQGVIDPRRSPGTRHLLAGIADLQHTFTAVRLSTVYESAAVGFAGANFFNLVAEAQTEMSLEQVLVALRSIEFAHGRAPDAKVQRWQDRINPIWKLIGGGCNLNRPIPSLLRDAGFVIQQLDEMYLPSTPKIAGYNYWGTAAKG